MKVGLNNSYLCGRVCHTFPSMYAASSPMGVENDPILRDKNGHQLFEFISTESLEKGERSVVRIDMYDLNDWKKFKLGPWSQKDEVSTELEDHVDVCLKLGKHFQTRMRCTVTLSEDELKHYPKVAVLVGDNYLDPDFFLWDTKKSSWIEWNSKVIKKYRPANYVPTDGTVSYISASQPPLSKGVNVMEYKARNNGKGIGSHRELMNDVQMIEKILEDLQEKVEA